MIVEGNGTKSVHIALFICLVTKAVHLEIARDLSAGEFLLALHRFVVRRGSSKFIPLDNASHFTFVQPLISQLVERRFEIADSRIRDYLNTKDIHWKFIPSYTL